MTHALVDTSLNARFTIRGSGQVSGNPFPAGHLRRGNEQPKASNEILAQRKIGGPRVRVAGGDVDVPEVDASIEHGRDESVAEHESHQNRINAKIVAIRVRNGSEPCMRRAIPPFIT